MTALSTWIGLPPVQALGAALAHFVWQGALIALLLGIFLALAHDARRRHDAAAVALLSMPLAFLATFMWSWGSQGAGGLEGAAVQGTSFGIWRGEMPAPYDASMLQTLLAHSAWAVPLWLAGVVCFSLRRLASWSAVRRLRASGVCAPPEQWANRLRALGAQLGIYRGMTLLESARVDAPAVIGLLKPVVLVPAGFLASCPPAEIEMILLHELAHVARRDYAVAALKGLIESVLFYHPAVWWVSSVITREREHCCDDMVVGLTRDPRAYATALARLEGLRSPAPAVGAKDGDLLARIRRLLAPKVQTSSPLSGAGLGLAAAGLALAFVQTPAVVAQEPLADSVYRLWLQNDVGYIITPEERETLQNLQTDDERKLFVQQFWERRDPTPGTPENEAKEEHYTRIADANQRFGSTFEGRVPGWRTARGRFYIIHGPPDEIEAHPSGGKSRDSDIVSADPWELWIYRPANGQAEIRALFVRTRGVGDYHLVEP